MKVSIILGTRPEIIKMSPIIRKCESQNLDYFILHTGQHYSYELDRVFFEELELPEARYNLDTGSGSHGEQTGRMLASIERVLLEETSDIVLVEGDTNSTLAGALVASKLHMKVGHVEAGLRSYDRNMPEEINRVLTDHISDYLFAPTEDAGDILLGEGIPESKVFVTGNTIVDAVYLSLNIAEKKVHILDELKLQKQGYLLATVHRAENTNVAGRLRGILEGLDSVHRELDLPVVFPVHPRTRKMMNDYQLKIPVGIELIEPVGFLEFLQLEANARLVLTDSGGVQEETCILKVPCVTLRDNTERPETLKVGSNVLVGVNQQRILSGVEAMIDKARDWNNPFGDGNAAGKIIDILHGKSN